MTKRFQHSGPHRDEVYEVSASRDINAPREEVWALIKPAENALLFEPRLTRAFHIPGTPEGVGGMQGFIYRHEGREHLTALEILDEVSEEYTVTRPIGRDDDSARTSYYLTDTPKGTRLELRQTFTVPRLQRVNAADFQAEYRAAATVILERIGLLIENGWKRRQTPQ